MLIKNFIRLADIRLIIISVTEKQTIYKLYKILFNNKITLRKFSPYTWCKKNISVIESHTTTDTF